MLSQSRDRVLQGAAVQAARRSRPLSRSFYSFLVGGLRGPSLVGAMIVTSWILFE